MALCLSAGSCTMHLWASTSESKTFWGEAEFTAWIEDGEDHPRIEMRLLEVDPKIRALLPKRTMALAPDFEANMADWLRERLEPSRGKRSPIETAFRSMRVGDSTAKNGDKSLCGWLQLSGTVPPLAEVLLPVGLDHGQPDKMDPALLEWISELEVRGKIRWVRYAPVDTEGKALTWAAAGRLVGGPGGEIGLIASAWDGKSWVHTQMPRSLLAARPRAELNLEKDGALRWKWSIEGTIVPAVVGEKGAATRRVALSPAPTVRLRHRGSEGVGLLGVLWRIPATPVTLVADTLLLPAVLVMGTAMLFGYDV